MNQPNTSTNPPIERTNWHLVLLCSGAAGAALFSLVYFCFGLISPNYYILRQSISNLQLEPHGWIQSLNYIVAGLLICAFAFGLRKEMVSGFGITLIPLFHALTGTGSIIMGIFPGPQVQFYIGGMIFCALLISFFLMARRLAADPRWRGWPNYTLLCAMLMVVLCGLYNYALTHKSGYGGVLERLIVIIRLVWLLFFTVRLLEGRSLALVGDKQTQEL